MIPRAVKMAKAVTDEYLPHHMGNILAPFYFSWPNNWGQYYTSGPNTGLGTMFSFSVHSFDTNGAPRWSQPPARRFNTSFSGALYPVADSLTPPPINDLG